MFPELRHRGHHFSWLCAVGRWSPALVSVPPVVTGRPGENAAEGVVKVKQSPAEHYNVVNVEDEADGDRANANATEEGGNLLPDGDATTPVVLTDAHLKEEDGNGTEDEENKVWYKKGTCFKYKRKDNNAHFSS